MIENQPEVIDTVEQYNQGNDRKREKDQKNLAMQTQNKNSIEQSEESSQKSDQNDTEQSRESAQTSDQNYTEEQSEEFAKRHDQELTYQDRKLFVGGINQETTEKELKDHFEQYGEIEDISLLNDRLTRRSRGFAFIVFKEVAHSDAAIAAGVHTINGKIVDMKKAKARLWKIFVGGLPPEVSSDDIRIYFAQFGNVVDVVIPYDVERKQHNNFCFVEYDSELGTNEALKEPKRTIRGKEVNVRRVTKNPKNPRVGGRGDLRRKWQRDGRRGGYKYGQRSYEQAWGRQQADYDDYSSSSGFGYGGYEQAGHVRYDQGEYGYGGYDEGYEYGQYGNGEYDYGQYGYDQAQGYGYGYSNYSDCGFHGSKQRGGRGGQRQTNRNTPY
ncbi:RNA-binding protein squid-like [Toxorhynchites rutilus septentrionalis]|uniref:RNA-binding protein squid-like n=1 Tax=Toxorhynchites rutilus septentrionalis TaxID=329112 RepID=UPI00247B2555|nr:RNA-binding protein squid-like [Toxorhynchites rutilus septentrionalis]